MKASPNESSVSAAADPQAISHLRLVGKIARELLAEPHPHKLIERVYRQLLHELDFEVYLHYRYDSAEEMLTLRSCEGIPPSYLGEIRRIRLGEAICGRVAQRREPMLVEHLQSTTESYTAPARALGLQAFFGHPLLAEGELIGTLSFGTCRRATVTEAERQLLGVVCGLIAVSIQRAQAADERERLLSNERAAREQLQQAIASVQKLNETLEQRVAQRTSALVQQQARLRSLASELTLTEQRQRRRLASELHDHLAQLLVASKMKLALVQDHVDGEPAEALREIDRFLNQSLSYTRTLIAEISPIILYERGLVAALHWLSEMFAGRYRLRVEVSAEPVPEVLGDDLKVMVFESVRELLFNVVKHAGTDRAAVTLRPHDGGLEVTVRDDGRGFAARREESADRAASASRFGLFNIEERMTLLGGRFCVESSPRRGTAVTLWVPLASVEPVGDLAAPSDEARLRRPMRTATGAIADRASIHVLVVDDHAVVREGLLLMLGRLKDVVVVGEAENGHQALDLARQLQPDVVLMDVSMPGLDGIETTRRLTAPQPEVRVIALSMYDDEGVAGSMRAAGASAYLCKGGAPDLLIDTIRRVAGEKTPT